MDERWIKAIEQVGGTGVAVIGMVVVGVWALGPELAEDRRQRAELTKQFTSVLDNTRNLSEALILQGRALRQTEDAFRAMQIRQDEMAKVLVEVLRGQARSIPPALRNEL